MPSDKSKNSEKIHFVTGRLAEPSLRRVLDKLAPQVGFEVSLQVMPISVAALMTPKWIAARIDVPADASRVVLPGFCDGDLRPIQEKIDVPVQIGPKELRRLPEFFGRRIDRTGYGQFDIEIIAEINHAPRLPLEEIVRSAQQMARDGADVIDVGCDPGNTWRGVADCVRALKDVGLRVSIDSLQPSEIEPAVNAGAELVLSVNSENRDAAVDWDCELVVIPDDPADWEAMEDTLQWLEARGKALRLDPIIEPIGLGFAQSLDRYLHARRRWPDAEFMMGIGNLTELTDVDSAGVNVLLLAFCQELGIRSVLTTEVINWARSSIRECDVARRLVYHAVQNQIPPKKMDDRLVTLRDPQVFAPSVEELRQLAETIRDNNYRIFAADEEIHLMGGGAHIHDEDPFYLFDQILAEQPDNIDASHAFYLGYEMCKAAVALALGKDYRQDQALDWGHLTVDETARHRLRRGASRDNPRDPRGEAE